MIFLLFALFSIIRESEGTVTCNVTKTLALSIQGDMSTSSWRLESEDQSEILLSGDSEEVITTCLPCGIYVLRIQDNSSTVQVRDSRDDFLTSCTSSISDSCRLEVGRTVRFYVHDGTHGGDHHEEISFDLYDPDELLVLSGGAPFDDNSICLERGMYNLQMTDSGGDGFHNNMAVTEDVQTGENLAMCGISSNTIVPVFEGECTVPIRSCTKVRLDVNTTGRLDLSFDGHHLPILSSQGPFSEELCLECGSYAVHTESPSAVTWTQVEDDVILSRCDSVICRVDVGSLLHVAVHPESGFHEGDWANEISWTLYVKDGSENILLHGGAPYRSTVCMSKGLRHLYMEDDWGDGWHNNYWQATDENGDVVSKCGLSDDASDGHCEINANSCISHTFAHTHDDTPWILHDHGKERIVWTGSNGEACLSCDRYVMSNVQGTVDVIDSRTSETKLSCSSDECSFLGGHLVEIQAHAGGFFQGDWQYEMFWEMFDSSNHDYVVSGGAPQEIEICIPSGDYYIEMIDSYGDGWHDNAVRLSINGSELSTCTVTELDGDHASCDVQIDAAQIPPPFVDTCHDEGMLRVDIVGNLHTSVWSLETIGENASEVMYGSGIDAVTSCLSCGVYVVFCHFSKRISYNDSSFSLTQLITLEKHRTQLRTPRSRRCISCACERLIRKFHYIVLDQGRV